MIDKERVKQLFNSKKQECRDEAFDTIFNYGENTSRAEAIKLIREISYTQAYKYLPDSSKHQFVMKYGEDSTFKYRGKNTSKLQAYSTETGTIWEY